MKKNRLSSLVTGNKANPKVLTPLQVETKALVMLELNAIAKELIPLLGIELPFMESVKQTRLSLKGDKSDEAKAQRALISDAVRAFNDKDDKDEAKWNWILTRKTVKVSGKKVNFDHRQSHTLKPAGKFTLYFSVSGDIREDIGTFIRDWSSAEEWNADPILVKVTADLNWNITSKKGKQDLIGETNKYKVAISFSFAHCKWDEYKKVLGM